MKRFLKRLGFHSLDEMEQAILFRAQRNAYIFLVISVLVWSLYESYKVYVYHNRLNLFPCLLLVMTMAIQSLSQFIITRNAVKDDENPYEAGAIVKIIVVICGIVSMIATIVTAIIFMGVKV